MTVPDHAWLDGNLFYGRVYLSNAAVDRFRRKVITALHDALPDAVAECLIDELMSAEEYGEKLPFRIKNQVDPVINAVLDEVKKLAVPYTAANGDACSMIPVERLDYLLK